MSANILSDDLSIGADVVSLLDGMVEPVALLSLEGIVRYENPAFRRLFGQLVGLPLSQLEASDKPRLDLFLRRSRGTTSALFGTMSVMEDPQSRHRILARRVQLRSGPALHVQLDAQAESRFAKLTRQVEELNKEIAERRHAEAVLQELVRERELLVRELQHRVKNNMQMLESMLRRAEREASTPEAKAAIQEVSAKVRAVAVVQRLLYAADNPTSLSSQALIEAVTASLASLAPSDVVWSRECDDFLLEVNTATAIALIVNELLTNAVKYGRPADGVPRIAVMLHKRGSSAQLVVLDNGPGFDPGDFTGASSGLALVKGLVRQIGGSWSIEHDQGARLTICFAHEQG